MAEASSAGLVEGEWRLTGWPLRSIRNLVKFHLIRSMPRAPKMPGLPALEEFEQRVRILAVDVDFGEDGKGDSIILVAELCDFGLGTGFLRSKLVAREAQNHQTAIFILLVERFQAGVLRSESALAGGIHHQHHPAGILRQMELQFPPVKSLKSRKGPL
jgi:hypothetical protein